MEENKSISIDDYKKLNRLRGVPNIYLMQSELQEELITGKGILKPIYTDEGCNEKIIPFTAPPPINLKVLMRCDELDHLWLE